MLKGTLSFLVLDDTPTGPFPSLLSERYGAFGRFHDAVAEQTDGPLGRLRQQRPLLPDRSRQSVAAQFPAGSHDEEVEIAVLDNDSVRVVSHAERQLQRRLPVPLIHCSVHRADAEVPTKGARIHEDGSLQPNAVGVHGVELQGNDLVFAGLHDNGLDFSDRKLTALGVGDGQVQPKALPESQHVDGRAWDFFVVFCVGTVSFPRVERLVGRTAVREDLRLDVHPQLCADHRQKKGIRVKCVVRSLQRKRLEKRRE